MPTARHGAVTVTVVDPVADLGSVTDQAMGADFFAAEDFPTATFKADLVERMTGLIADGTLRIKDQSVPVSMPVTLIITGDTGRCHGQRSRWTGAISASALDTQDESTLAFDVRIDWALTARAADDRQPNKEARAPWQRARASDPHVIRLITRPCPPRSRSRPPPRR